MVMAPQAENELGSGDWAYFRGNLFAVNAFGMNFVSWDRRYRCTEHSAGCYDDVKVWCNVGAPARSGPSWYILGVRMKNIECDGAVTKGFVYLFLPTTIGIIYKAGFGDIRDVRGSLIKLTET